MSARTRSEYQAKVARTRPAVKEGVPLAQHAPHSYHRGIVRDRLDHKVITKRDVPGKVKVTMKKKPPRQPAHLMHQALRSLDKAGYESEKGQRHALGMSGKEVHRVKKHVKHKLLGFDSNKGFIAGEMQRKSYKAAHKRADKARRKAVF